MYKKILAKTYNMNSIYKHCSVCDFCDNMNINEEDEQLSKYLGPCFLDSIIYLLDLLPFRMAYKLGLLHEFHPKSDDVSTEEILDPSIQSLVMKCNLCQKNCILKNDCPDEANSLVYHEIKVLFDKIAGNKQWIYDC